MSLEKQIDKDYIDAMKAKDTVRSSALSYLRAMVKQVKVDQRLEVLDDAGVTAVIKKQIKQRQDSIEQYRAANRPDLADREAAELGMLQEYLPQPLSQEELTAAIEAAVAETGATSPKEMGAVINAIMAKYKGRVDGKALSAAVRARLAG